MLNNTPNSTAKSLNDINNAEVLAKIRLGFCMISLSYGDGFRDAAIALLRECYAKAAGESANKQVIEALSYASFPNDYFSEDELEILSEHLEEVFQYISESGTDFGYDSSLASGFIQPQEVTDFMCEIASFPNDVTVYNPFAGAGSYAVNLPNTVEGEEISPATWAVGQIRLFAMGITPRTDIKLEDSFVSMASDKKYKAIISSPVYLMEKGKRIGDVLCQLYDKLEEGGTMVCLACQSFLSEEVSSSAEIRKRLIDDRAIKAVITIPNNIFSKSNVHQVAILITKGVANEYVILADASDYTRFTKSVYRQTSFDWEQFLEDMRSDVDDYWERGEYVEEGSIAVPLPYDQIRGYDLFPAKYLVPQPEGVKLSDIATAVPELRGEDVTADYFITASSIPAAQHRKPFVPTQARREKITTSKRHIQISGDAVIITIISGEIRTVYTEAFNGKIAYPGGFIGVLKPKEGYSAKYLAAILSVKPVADQIKAQCVGTMIPQLDRLDLSQIIVPVWESPELREKLVSEVISEEMGELESELQQILAKHKREVRSTRHAMVQTLSALSSNWEQLKMFANMKGGRIDFTDTIGRVNPITVENLLTSIGYAISTLERQVESLRFEKADWGEDVEINPYGFINEYISTHSTPNVKMVNVGSDNSADIPEMNEVTGDVTYYHTDAMNIFYAPKRLLERVFNNIVSNAKAHGFTSESEYPEIRFDWQEVNGDIVITVANNGLPLKDGVTSEDVLMSGFSTSLNERAADGTFHSGQGGFEIKSLMDGLGSVEILSEPEGEFPVIYKLTFTNTNTVRIN